MERTATVANNLARAGHHDQAALITALQKAMLSWASSSLSSCSSMLGRTFLWCGGSCGALATARRRWSMVRRATAFGIAARAGAIQRRDALSNCWLRPPVPCIGLIRWLGWLRGPCTSSANELAMTWSCPAAFAPPHMQSTCSMWRRGLTSSPWTQACGLAMARNSSLHGRITAVLNERQNRRNLTTRLLAFSIVITIALLIPVAMLSAASEAVAMATNGDQIDDQVDKKQPEKQLRMRQGCLQA